MATTTLGKNGLTVTPIIIGTWSWGDNLFWDYGSDYGNTEVEAAFKAALEEGINFFDTAEIYGKGLSEELLGTFMQKNTQPVQIASKYAPKPLRFSSFSVTNALTESLKRLSVPKIALYQVHWPRTYFMGQKTLLNTLADEVKKGRIEAIGVSKYSAEQMQKAYEILADKGIKLATNQVEYSLLSRQIESQGILDKAKKLGMTILAYCPLAQGLLTGKYTVENLPKDRRKLRPYFQKSELEKIKPVISLLTKIGEKYGKTPAQVALNWLVCQDNVIPIAGCKNAEQVRQNVGAIGWEIGENEFNQLEQITRPWLQ
ncbi:MULTISPECIES: aldo/keto reductase [unclassified Okeania]|uniref:aldo/keto reductase n=1 Tax=unclassified Okeania TaxID=2634635 RepID=UPI0013BD78EA|nr:MULTISPECIES: aldo/keto reductase [unclassified Okeania]NES77474.1 aldo/keto reductase [Okeania sp. SIO1H4]NET16207.1 aldo/keto reductase [Okeania sp. SIO1H6]NET21154.1 aldo/keto reductase [Okeania sp. SIO1H5]NET94247.1 aldo/keto reductase [Okeania sp. SIO1H2]